MSPQPRNTKIMRREGPWGLAGWFRSRYLTLTDATAGRLERSRHSAEHPPPPPPPPGQVDGCPGRPQPQAATPPGGRRECVPVGGVGGGYEARQWGQGAAGPRRQQCGLLRAPWPSGMVLCGETQSMLLLCLCSCEPECVWGREAECGCVTETKIIFVCVLRVTQGWRVQLMSLK